MIDYFASNMWQLWLLLSVICLILELSNGDFYIMCFAIGAAFTAITSSLPIDAYMQLIIFAVASTLSIFFIRPFAINYLHAKGKERPSNADALIGQKGRVSEKIVEGGYGRVAVDGDDWKAVSSDGKEIALGRPVKIVGRDSIIVTVESI